MSEAERFDFAHQQSKEAKANCEKDLIRMEGRITRLFK
jgi:hypothetical protein